jgi:hypothetical protein
VPKRGHSVSNPDSFEVEIPVPDGMTEDQAIDKYMDGVEKEVLKRLGF